MLQRTIYNDGLRCCLPKTMQSDMFFADVSLWAVRFGADVRWSCDFSMLYVVRSDLMRCVDEHGTNNIGIIDDDDHDDVDVDVDNDDTIIQCWTIIVLITCSH